MAWIRIVEHLLLNAQLDVILLTQELQSSQVGSALFSCSFVRVEASVFEDIDDLVEKLLDLMLIPLVAFGISSETCFDLLECLVDEVDVAVTRQLSLFAFFLLQLLDQKAIFGIEVEDQRIPLLPVLNSHPRQSTNTISVFEEGLLRLQRQCTSYVLEPVSCRLQLLEGLTDPFQVVCYVGVVLFTCQRSTTLTGELVGFLFCVFSCLEEARYFSVGFLQLLLDIRML